MCTPASLNSTSASVNFGSRLLCSSVWRKAERLLLRMMLVAEAHGCALKPLPLVAARNVAVRPVTSNQAPPEARLLRDRQTWRTRQRVPCRDSSRRLARLRCQAKRRQEWRRGTQGACATGLSPFNPAKPEVWLSRDQRERSEN